MFGTETLKIGDLISKRLPFVVPRYQRAYAWEAGEAEEVSDFISDVNGLLEARFMNKPKGHFFGGLVSIEKPAPGTETGRLFEVVDGQQRLATFMITINLITKAFLKLSEAAKQSGASKIKNAAKAHAGIIENSFIKYTEVEGDEARERLRLKLSKADNDYFERLMEGVSQQSPRDSHKRLQRAMDKIDSELIEPIINNTTASLNEKLQRLLALKACLTDDCFVIHIKSEDPKEAYRLFAILNDRGKPLSDGDLLRAYTLQLLEGNPRIQQQVESHWDSILKYTDNDIDRFLRYYYASCVGERAPKRDLFNSFKEKFFKALPETLSASQARGLERLVNSIRLESNTFAKLNIGEWPYDNPTATDWDRNRFWRLMSILRHDLCLPLLLSAHSQWGAQEKKFVELINLLERFVFRYISIVKNRPSRLADKYYKNAVAIRKNSATYLLDSLAKDLRDLMDRDADVNQFTNQLAKLSYDDSTQRRIIRHFLTTLEDYYTWFNKGAKRKAKPDKSRSFDVMQNTIEHIYPQNPKTPTADLAPLVNDIGNLSFWGPDDNVEAGNKSFTDKKKLYISSSVRLNRELASLPDWNKAELEGRRKRLIEMALKIFVV
jgi:uncharacterized protein with ParB-like and HNH nuclease domain